MQTHYLNYDLAVAGGVSGLAGLSAIFPQNRCGESNPRACFSVEQYLDLLFGQSDTNMTVLSAIPIVERGAEAADAALPAIREAYEQRLAGV